ncbi:hypothetical protein KO561_11850 [Radiobacillus kanasensis]|uniref:hypothetical protein n=1 Tax=Radiobacillus kanasensis TaxID=2844358 RepID=UPI001E3FABE0|nr:hypothetical protein [Radiobacillus kanasensis]UFT97902.1 hypothetical protein KO561_11850 [Radiobacillus kanasensis]
MNTNRYAIYLCSSLLLYLYGVMIIQIETANTAAYPVDETISGTFFHCFVLISICTISSTVLQCSSYAFIRDQLLQSKTRIEQIITYSSLLLFGISTPFYVLFIMMTTVAGGPFLLISFLITIVMCYVIMIQYVCFYKQPKEAAFLFNMEFSFH